MEENGGGIYDTFIPTLSDLYTYNASYNRYAEAFNIPSGGTWWCNGGNVVYTSSEGDINVTFRVGIYSGGSMIYTSELNTSPRLNFINGIKTNNVVVFRVA